MPTAPQREPAGAGASDDAQQRAACPSDAPDASLEVCGVEIGPEPAAPLAAD